MNLCVFFLGFYIFKFSLFSIFLNLCAHLNLHYTYILSGTTFFFSQQAKSYKTLTHTN